MKLINANTLLEMLGDKKYLCKTCGGIGWYAEQVSETEQEQRQCNDCYGEALEDRGYNDCYDKVKKIIDEYLVDLSQVIDMGRLY